MKYIALAVIVVLVCTGIVLAWAPWAAQHGAAPAAVSSVASTTPLRQAIDGFGHTLKDVSLIAPDAGAQIAAKYAPFVAPQLLAEWEADPSTAPGRQTSSPWPDYIEIISVTQGKASTTVTVSGRVIEVASGSGGLVPAATYPVTMTLERQNATWLITSFSKGDYLPLPAPITMTGTWGCLPRKDASGPQTAECALGLKASDGYYAIDTSLVQTNPLDFATGQAVQVTGTVTPVAKLSAPQQYDIQGIIRAAAVTKI